MLQARARASGRRRYNGGNAAKCDSAPTLRAHAPGQQPISPGFLTLPGDIPRPHPMARPTVNNNADRHGGRGRGGRGGFRGGRPAQGAGGRVRGSGDRTVMAVAHSAAASRAAEHWWLPQRRSAEQLPEQLRTMVPLVAAVVVAAVPQAHSAVRVASLRRPARTGWRSAANMRR